jgi:hypothetical protein
VFWDQVARRKYFRDRPDVIVELTASGSASGRRTDAGNSEWGVRATNSRGRSRTMDHCRGKTPGEYITFCYAGRTCS